MSNHKSDTTQADVRGQIVHRLFFEQSDLGVQGSRIVAFASQVRGNISQT